MNNILELFITLLFIIFFLISLFAISKRYGFRKKLSVIFFGLSSLLSIINYYYQILDPLPDASLFHNLALQTIDNHFYFGNSIVEQSFGAVFFVNFIIVPFYIFFGDNALNVIIFNNFLIALVYMMIVRISIDIFKYFTFKASEEKIEKTTEIRIEYFSFILVFFYPSLFMYRLFLLRDPLIIFATVLFMFSLLLIVKKNINFRNMFLFIISLFLIIVIRPQNAPVLFICLIFIILMIKNINIFYKIIGLFISISIIFVFSELQVFRFLSLINPEYLMSYRYSQVIQFNSYLPQIYYSSWLDILKLAPLTTFYYIFVPFFWLETSYEYLIPSIDSLFIFILFILLLILSVRQKFPKNNMKNYLLFLMIFSLISLISYSIVEVYFGGAVRHRMQQIIVVFPILIGWIAKKRSNYKN
ncbi:MULTISPECIES: hypothetical protein [unclassified Exiguobacterium]|uniref:hypothetical protein n=1 Tax=unclassified Exiguobacterium TaxID=2644629 RepID=UPI001BEAFF05|nr:MULTISPECIES: hypothetical protein [unclassified Exiguobacterium]